MPKLIAIGRHKEKAAIPLFMGRPMGRNGSSEIHLKAAKRFHVKKAGGSGIFQPRKILLGLSLRGGLPEFYGAM